MSIRVGAFFTMEMLLITSLSAFLSLNLRRRHFRPPISALLLLLASPPPSPLPLHVIPLIQVALKNGAKKKENKLSRLDLNNQGKPSFNSISCEREEDVVSQTSSFELFRNFNRRKSLVAFNSITYGHH